MTPQCMSKSKSKKEREREAASYYQRNWVVANVTAAAKVSHFSEALFGIYCPSSSSQGRLVVRLPTCSKREGYRTSMGEVLEVWHSWSSWGFQTGTGELWGIQADLNLTWVWNFVLVWSGFCHSWNWDWFNHHKWAGKIDIWYCPSSDLVWKREKCF